MEEEKKQTKIQMVAGKVLPRTTIDVLNLFGVLD